MRTIVVALLALMVAAPSASAALTPEQGERIYGEIQRAAAQAAAERDQVDSIALENARYSTVEERFWAATVIGYRADTEVMRATAVFAGDNALATHRFEIWVETGDSCSRLETEGAVPAAVINDLKLLPQACPPEELSAFQWRQLGQHRGKVNRSIGALQRRWTTCAKSNDVYGSAWAACSAGALPAYTRTSAAIDRTLVSFTRAIEGGSTCWLTLRAYLIDVRAHRAGVSRILAAARGNRREAASRYSAQLSDQASEFASDAANLALDCR